MWPAGALVADVPGLADAVAAGASLRLLGVMAMAPRRGSAASRCPGCPSRSGPTTRRPSWSPRA
jgi:hypothetical protein